jgi:CMP-N-acetylneuraminic acid synthetase/spore coat polysaccharide biosynthesis predicted glycosyltransferase SpsG
MSIDGKRIIAIIPARGNSKGIPRKNIRFLAGKPLISYSIYNCKNSKYIDRIVVSSDDDEINYFSSRYEIDTLKRPSNLALDDTPLDIVIYHAITELEKQEIDTGDIVITVQPTSPLLSFKTIDKAIENFVNDDVDTLLSVVDDRSLTWTKIDNEYVPNYIERKNRQYLPAIYKETGGIVIAKKEIVMTKTRFGKKVAVIELDKNEAVDIDNETDWWIAEKLLNKKKVLIRTTGYPKIGLGHVYRMLLFAEKLIDHEFLFVLDQKSTIGLDLIKANNYKALAFENFDQLNNIIETYIPDIIINDILDTSNDYIEYLKQKNIFVVNFEDSGAGAKKANLIINAMYNEKYPWSNYYCGQDYYCLREEFLELDAKEIKKQVDTILISFGGTDPNNYTQRVLEIIDKLNLKNIKILLILGLGYEHTVLLQNLISKMKIDIEVLQNIKHISKYMHAADIAVTSAGRTVYELAAVGTPSIVLAQNKREMRHTFACSTNGIINLGLGYQVSDDEIKEVILNLMNNYEQRLKCSQLMLKNDLKSGIQRVLSLIFNEFNKFVRNGKNECLSKY